MKRVNGLRQGTDKRAHHLAEKQKDIKCASLV